MILTFVSYILVRKLKDNGSVKTAQMLKDAASPQKIEWLYINRICIAIITFVASIFIFSQLHKIAINYVYTEPTTNYDLIRTDYPKKIKRKQWK